MTPDEYRAAMTEALRPLAEFVAKNAELLSRIDSAVTKAGERMADEAEAWANGGRR